MPQREFRHRSYQELDLDDDRRTQELEVPGDARNGRGGTDQNERDNPRWPRRGGNQTDRAAERVADESDPVETARVEVTQERLSLARDGVIIWPGPVGEAKTGQVHRDGGMAGRGRSERPLPTRGGRQQAVNVDDRNPATRGFPRAPPHTLHEGVLLSRA